MNKLKFKRLERVAFKNFSDFGKIVKLYPDTNEYLVVPDGADQHWTMKETELERIK